MATGNDISRNTRPTSAGLKMLHPRPPKAILAMPMAIAAPAATIHSGSDEGRFRARSTPVTSAVPSVMVDGRRSMKRVTAHSTATQVRHDTAKTPSAGSPKKSTDAAMAGRRATSTSRIMPSVLRRVCMCGEGENMMLILRFVWRYGYS